MIRKRRLTGAGALDQRVIVQEEARAADGLGGYAVSWTTVGTIWASVVPVRGQERVIADQQAGVQTYRVTVRNQDTGAAVTTAHRLVWRGQTMNVRVAPVLGRDMYRTLEADIKVAT